MILAKKRKFIGQISILRAFGLSCLNGNQSKDLGTYKLSLSDTPYFGRELRYFNQAPWWYRYEFELPTGNIGKLARLWFEGVDYYCKVWLNEQFVCEHEGYSTPFSCEVGNLLQSTGPNLLIVKVWSSWDKELDVRDMLKGTYEHDDTFIQRDVNPVGLWGTVKLIFHESIYIQDRLLIDTENSPTADSADVRINLKVSTSEVRKSIQLKCRILEKNTGVQVSTIEHEGITLQGETPITLTGFIQNPKLWQTWDRGEPWLYEAVIELWADNDCLQVIKERFGIRKVEIRRTREETSFLLNGKKIYVRGTTYFPDIYVSTMHYYRYYRDLTAIKRAGCNAVRIHVHVEKMAFYDLCDEMGIMIIQDSDFNWGHPTDGTWQTRATKVFTETVNMLRNHPSIICWICMNEPRGGPEGVFMSTSPGPQFVEMVKRIDPSRPYIKGSGCKDDIESGDSHNYMGSLDGENTHYTDIFGSVEKFNTEFGFDAPPCMENLVRIPELYNRLKGIIDNIDSLQNYQYHLLKYFIEHYRLLKYQPCSGYFQFLFIDLSPQSFYGVYDWWGMPKGGLKAFEESGQPLGVFMEHKDQPIALWVVNDYSKAFHDCQVEWIVCDNIGSVLIRNSKIVDIPEDSISKVSELSFKIESSVKYNVSLYIWDSKGELLIKNIYMDAFTYPAHPKGHPMRMNSELGMRLYSE